MVTRSSGQPKWQMVVTFAHVESHIVPKIIQIVIFCAKNTSTLARTKRHCTL